MRNIFTSPSAIQSVKDTRIKEKLDVLSQLENGEQIADIRHDDELPHTRVCKICNNADRIEEVLRV